MQALAPPTILAQASRLNFSTRLFNLLVTNVPGPQFPLYVLGRRLQDLFPVAFLPKNHALAVAIMSYEGGMDFGLLADYDAMPDLEQFAGMVDESVVELVTAAAAEQADPERNGKGRVSSRARTSRPRTSSRATTEA
jgi:diacylglycerol O-acyltransferase / wax synthase